VFVPEPPSASKSATWSCGNPADAHARAKPTGLASGKLGSLASAPGETQAPPRRAMVGIVIIVTN
jgi:hypothetical protein